MTFTFVLDLFMRFLVVTFDFIMNKIKGKLISGLHLTCYNELKFFIPDPSVRILVILWLTNSGLIIEPLKLNCVQNCVSNSSHNI